MANQAKTEFYNRMKGITNFAKDVYQGAKENIKSGQGLIGNLEPKKLAQPETNPIQPTSPVQDVNVVTPKINEKSNVITKKPVTPIVPVVPEVPNTITGDSMKETTPIVLPEKTIDTSSSTLTSDIVTKTNLEQQQADKVAAEEAKRETGQSDIVKSMMDVAGVESKGATEVSQAGAETAAALRDVNLRINTASQALRDYKDNLYNNPELTQTMASNLATEAERKTSSTLANYSIYKSALQGDLEAAKQTAKDKVDAELAPLKADLEAKKFIWDNNKDNLSKAEQNLLNTQIRDDERAYKKEENILNGINNIMLTAGKNQAPADIMQKIGNAKSEAEAMQIAAQYLQSPLDKLQLEQARLNIQKTRNDLNALSPNATVAAKVDSTKNLKGLISDLMSMAGQEGAVGVSLNKLVSFGSTVPGSAAFNYKSTFNQLKDTLAMENIGKLKGAMSDKDLEFLRNTATKLNLGMSEEAFRGELKKLDNTMNDVLLKNGVDPSQINSFSGMSNEELLNTPTQNISNKQFFGK